MLNELTSLMNLTTSLTLIFYLYCTKFCVTKIRIHPSIRIQSFFVFKKGYPFSIRIGDSIRIGEIRIEALSITKHNILRLYIIKKIIKLFYSLIKFATYCRSKPHLPRWSLQYLEISKFGKIPDCNNNNIARE